MTKFNISVSVFCLLATLARPFDFTIPAELREKYRYLYSLPVVQTENGATFHQARLYHRSGIRVLYLKGDRFEMAYQHGRLLSKEVELGTVPQAAKMLERAVRNGFPAIPVVTNLVIANYYRTITEKIIENASQLSGEGASVFLMDGYGLSEGSGVDLKTLAYGALAPESLQVLLGQHSARSAPSPAGYSPSCSDFAVWGSRSPKMVIGRNTDYPLNGNYDRYPTVFYFEPTDGMQRFMSVSSAGVQNAGVLGVNASGIYLGIHSVPTLDVSNNGIPAFFIGQSVLKRATTLDEALELFKLYHPPSGWTFMVASLNEERAASVEMTNTGLGIRLSTGEFHVQTNHFQTPLMTEKFFGVNHSTETDSFARQIRITNLIGQSTKLNIHAVASILGDKLDPLTQNIRTLPNTVAVQTSMTSAIVDSANGRIFVANGTAPVSLNEFVELPLVGRFDPDTFAKEPFDTFHVPGFKESHPELALAEQHFIRAKIAYETELDHKKASAIMNSVIALDTNNPAMRFVAAIVALKAKERAKGTGHLKLLAKTKSGHHQRLGLYYLGRVLADEGQKISAKELFSRIKKEANLEGEENLKRAAELAIRACQSTRPFPLKEGRLGLMMQQADMLSY